MIARKFGNVKSRKLQPREDDELDSVTTAGAPPVRRIFSRDLRQPSRYGDRAEKLHALSALKAGVQWKMSAMAKRKDDNTDFVREEASRVALQNAVPATEMQLLPSEPSKREILKPEDVLEAAAVPAVPRKRFRFSFFSRIFGCLPRRDRETKDMLRDLDRGPEYRPYFTYWVTFVQVVVLLIALIGYGFAPFGFGVMSKSEEELLRPNLAVEKVCRFEYNNLWIGPRQADLIRLGARYSPCMRFDKNLHAAITLPDKIAEKNSACCVRNDGSGCYQTSKGECSETLSAWLKWPEADGAFGGDGVNRTSGSVCGQDPAFCMNPPSVQPFVWKDDITKWPQCQSEKLNVTIKHSTLRRHMTCEVTGRPCCIGIKGECVITSRQHCDFMRGYYHQNASLCSQVNCLNEVCGLLPFTLGGSHEVPDQFYRLFLSIFLHAGLLHLLITLVIQLVFMADIEKMAGWHRTSIIYLLSGIVGNLCSGIFVPYQVESGPTGCHFALLGMIVVEINNAWAFIKDPWRVALKYVVFAFFALCIGLLPWVDNYSHVAGFISGIFLSYVFLPFASIGRSDDTKMRIFTIVIFTTLWLTIFMVLILFFYLYPVVDCQFCKYINCIPLVPDFCDNMGVNVTTRTRCIAK